MARALSKFYTVGYEGTSIEEFCAFLVEKKIARVADVRKNPVSRKKGFSKRRLAEELGRRGIEYLHLPALGMPREWRKLAKEGKITRARMFRDFVRKILPVERESVDLLRAVAREKPTAILCYENDPSDCHRRMVAEEMERLSGGKSRFVDLDVRERFGGGAFVKGLEALR